MPEQDLKSELLAMVPERCCLKAVIAAIAVGEAAAQRNDINNADAKEKLESIIDLDCIGMTERENSRDGCLDGKCNHKRGPYFMQDSVSLIDFGENGHIETGVEKSTD